MNKTSEMTPKSAFGEWLFVNMLKNDLTCVDVAKMLRSTRQSIRNHINDIAKPSYVWVIAYCSIFNDNPEEVWKLVNEEL